jgi:hypothetical protein
LARQISAASYTCRAPLETGFFLVLFRSQTTNLLHAADAKARCGPASMMDLRALDYQSDPTRVVASMIGKD